MQAQVEADAAPIVAQEKRDKRSLAHSPDRRKARRGGNGKGARARSGSNNGDNMNGSDATFNVVVYAAGQHAFIARRLQQADAAEDMMLR